VSYCTIHRITLNDDFFSDYFSQWGHAPIRSVVADRRLHERLIPGKIVLLTDSVVTSRSSWLPRRSRLDDDQG